MRKNTIYAIVMILSSLLAAVSCSGGDSAAGFRVGDIVLTNGKHLSADEFRNYQGKAKPVAVIFSITGATEENSARILGVALDQSPEPVPFSAEGSPGENTAATENRLSFYGRIYDADRKFFINSNFMGDFDGCDNMKHVSPPADGDLKKEFPAFAAAKRHGDGWYLPTAAELNSLFLALPQVSQSIAAAGGTPLSERIYWSSSQCYYMDDLELTVDFENGEISVQFKDKPALVRAVREFRQKKHGR